MDSKKQAESCLVCTAGLLGASKRTAIGTALSRETRMRVFEDECFIRLLQDAWLQEELKRSSSPASFLADLFKSRGRGPDTPFFPQPSVIVLIEGQTALQARRHLLAKSAQTGDQEGTAEIPLDYIEMLMRAYCDHIADVGRSIPVIHISLDELQPSFSSTNAPEAGAALATAVGEKLRHLQPRSTERRGSLTPLSPPLSPTSAGTQEIWKRLDAVVPLVL